MSVHVIKVPDIGEGIAEVELVAWHVRPGDAVAEDQVLADVMTDKATVEIPSPVAGKVLALSGEAGEAMAVGGELIRLEVEGTGGVAAERPSAGAEPEPERERRKREARAPGVAPAARPPSTTATAAARRPPTEPARSLADRPRASPSVRWRARQMGIDLRVGAGSGPKGRIVHADLDAFASGAPAAETREAGRYVKRRGEERIPVIGLRRRIAQAMQASKRDIPHFSYVEELDVTELEALRGALNVRWERDRGRLTLLPFLARAIANAVLEFPQLNATYDDASETLIRHAPVHLGIATQTDAGLMVPVLRHAEAMDPWACAREIARLAQAARSGKATRDELRGSTITVTSLGALGGIASTPVINPPEVAIIGVNRIIERPVYQRGHVVPRLLMNLSSSFDHRVVDGMVGAGFVQRLRAQLENPAMLFIE